MYKRQLYEFAAFGTGGSSCNTECDYLRGRTCGTVCDQWIWFSVCGGIYGIEQAVWGFGDGCRFKMCIRDRNESIVKEKIHTNVSLLSKFRGFLVQQKILKSDLDFLKMQVGDFIEVEGELQKNPIINYMDSFIDLFRMANIFAEQPQVGGKTQAKNQKKKDDEMVKQIKLFADELKHSGTIDFILSDNKGTTVLSVQEQYLANDNISEIIGGHFKVCLLYTS